ncbi:Protein ORANGE-GREEN, chloroplastic, partial [Cucurbita argyrosperma subsp. argyrosperma]
NRREREYHSSTWHTALAQFFGFSEFFPRELQKFALESTRIPTKIERFASSLVFSMDRVLVASYPINHSIRPRSFRIDYCWSTGLTFRLSSVKKRQKLSSRWRCQSMASDSADSSSSSSFAPSIESDPSDKNSASFCIIEGPETVEGFAKMELQEIQENIRSRRNKIFLHMEEVRRLRIQQRIKNAELGFQRKSEKTNYPIFHRSFHFYPP